MRGLDCQYEAVECTLISRAELSRGGGRAAEWGSRVRRSSDLPSRGASPGERRRSSSSRRARDRAQQAVERRSLTACLRSERPCLISARVDDALGSASPASPRLSRDAAVKGLGSDRLALAIAQAQRKSSARMRSVRADPYVALEGLCCTLASPGTLLRLQSLCPSTGPYSPSASPSDLEP